MHSATSTTRVPQRLAAGVKVMVVLLAAMLARLPAAHAACQHSYYKTLPFRETGYDVPRDCCTKAKIQVLQQTLGTLNVASSDVRTRISQNFGIQGSVSYYCVSGCKGSYTQTDTQSSRTTIQMRDHVFDVSVEECTCTNQNEKPASCKPVSAGNLVGGLGRVFGKRKLLQNCPGVGRENNAYCSLDVKCQVTITSATASRDKVKNVCVFPK